MKNLGKIIWIVVLIAIIVLIGVVGVGYYKKITYKQQNPIATIVVEGFGEIKVELYPDQAPEAVSNFIALANGKFYDGTGFHRIMKEFMIQAGSKNGDGITGAKVSNLKDGGEEESYTIKGEFIANGVENTIKFEEGTIGMARGGGYTEDAYNSACSQFFIMTEKNTSLNGQYAGFGKVIGEGMEIVHKISEVEVTVADGQEQTENAEVSKPVNQPKITSIRVDTFGEDYGIPEILKLFN